MKAVVLHGGRGSRLRPLSNTIPKQLIPIAGRPISQFVLEDLKNSGIKEIVITLGDIHPEKVRECYGNGSKFGLSISYVEQGKPGGIAQAVGLCKDFVKNDKFVVYLGDNLLKTGISTFVQEFAATDSDAMFLFTRVNSPSAFGVAEFDGGKLIRVVEKPKYPPSSYAICGIYFFTNSLFKAIESIKPSGRQELEITDSIQWLIDQKMKVEYRIVQDWWKDVGSSESLLEANRFVLSQDIIENGASIKGKIVSPCFIGSGTTIDEKCIIGPYVSIGRGCSLEDVRIEDSIVMDNCTIRRYPKKISESIIGKFTTIQGESESSKFLVGEDCQIVL